MHLGRLDELTDPGSRAFTLGTGSWPLRGFVVRRGADVYAYVNRCPHAGHPLNMRPDQFLSIDGELIQRQSHGALFDVASGMCVAGPCPGRVLMRRDVRMENGSVALEGDPVALAHA